MPLKPDEKSMGGRFNGLDDPVRRLGADDEAGRGLLDRLMVRTVDPKGSLFDNAIEHAARDDGDGVALG